MQWISINDQLPTLDLMVEQDILIWLEDNSFGAGVFYYEGNYVIRGMRFNGVTKHIDMWKRQPIYWMIVDPPSGE